MDDLLAGGPEDGEGESDAKPYGGAVDEEGDGEDGEENEGELELDLVAKGLLEKVDAPANLKPWDDGEDGGEDQEEAIVVR